jgi:hypothetical protein
MAYNLLRKLTYVCLFPFFYKSFFILLFFLILLYRLKWSEFLPGVSYVTDAIKLKMLYKFHTAIS